MRDAVIISAVFCATLVASAFAVGPQAHHAAAARAKAGGVSPTYIIEEDFEGTGTPSSWFAASGTPDYDQSTAGLSLEGSECLELDATSADAGAGYYTWSPATDNVYSTFLMRLTALPASVTWLVRIRDGFTTHGELALLSSGLLFVKSSGGSSDTGTFTVATNTTYRVWLEYETGSGSDAVTRMFIATTDTKPGTADCESTNGTDTGTLNAYYFYADNDGGQIHYFDDLKIDEDAAIGSNP